MHATAEHIDVYAPAKINLYLELLGKRADGFHELETVISTIGIYDGLRFKATNNHTIRFREIRFAADSQENPTSFPTHSDNLIVQALDRLRNVASKRAENHVGSLGCDIWLFKNIPSEAGLGGASSNAAAALLAGNRLWELNLSDHQLWEIAAELGSDIPFFLTGGMALCTGRGELIQPLGGIKGIPIVVAKPTRGCSTAKIFSECRIEGDIRNSAAIVAAIEGGEFNSISTQVFNRLQNVASNLNEQISDLSAEFDRLNCVGHQMSGSGSSYVGYFATTKSARIAAKVLSARLPMVRIQYTTTLNAHGLTANHAA